MKINLMLSFWVCLFPLLSLVNDAKADILEGPSFSLNAQQNPTTVDWASLTTTNFKIIFPRPLEAEARRVAGILEVVYAPVSEGLGTPPRLINVVLQAHTLNSNGFVTLAPRRSEWFVAPWLGPDVGQTEWLRTLAVHEFRHVVQFEKSRAGFEKFLRALFGEVGTALSIGLTLPPWYLEGDAVGTETALSSAGRGRLPQFPRDLRTLLLDGQDYNYEQLALGSYKNYVPNHYVVGYHLTTYLRRRFGKEVLEKMHAETMERAYNPLAFFNSLERVTGVKFDDAYRDCLKELTALWRAQDAVVQLVPVESLDIKGTRGWTNFSFPAPISSTEILSYRHGLSNIGQFVRVKEGQEAEVLWTPAPLLQDFPFKIRKNKVAYAEMTLHPRWGMQDFSKVVVKDMEGETQFQSAPSNWMLPVLDHEAKRLAVFDWVNEGQPSLKIIDVASGNILQSFPWDREQAVMGLDWIPNKDKLIVLHRQGTYNLVLLELGLDSRRREIARSSKYNWAYPTATDTHVYFQSSASGIDNIHRISFADGIEERVTSDRFGAYHPAVNGDELLYSQYQPQGLRPVRVPLSQVKIMPPGPDNYVQYYQPLVEQEGKGDIVDSAAISDAPLETYSLPKHAWNPHSWTIIGNYFGSSISPAIISTDILNNLQLMAGLGFNLNERTQQIFAGARWSYYYPIWDIKAAFGSRRETDLPFAFFGKKEDKWEEGSAEIGMTLPWQSVWRRWTSQAQLRFSGGILQSRGRVYPDFGDLADQTLFVPAAEFQAGILQRQAPRDLLPPWGLQAFGKYSGGKSISDARQADSYQKSIGVRPFMPGAWYHHHLFGEISYEEQNGNGYHFATQSLFARGWSSRFLEKRTKTSVNYALPLWYADWNLSRYYYLKRLSLNLFHDNIWGSSYGFNRNYETTGAELWFDSHFLRNSFPIQWGLRYNVPGSSRETQSVELFLNLGVTSF